MEPNDSSKEFAECLKKSLEEMREKLKVSAFAQAEILKKI